MLAADQVDKIALDVASATLGRAALERVFNEARLGPEGEDGIRITIVLTRDGEVRLDGEMVIKTLFGIGVSLLDADDERVPMVDFTTEDELATVDDSEL